MRGQSPLVSESPSCELIVTPLGAVVLKLITFVRRDEVCVVDVADPFDDVCEGSVTETGWVANRHLRSRSIPLSFASVSTNSSKEDRGVSAVYKWGATHLRQHQLSLNWRNNSVNEVRGRTKEHVLCINESKKKTRYRSRLTALLLWLGVLSL
jgi:hypothetical protein